MRHYYALSHLDKTTLCENILTPGAIRVFHNHPTIREDDMVDLVCTLLCLLLYDMSKGLKMMSLGVINHGMSLSVQTNFEKTMFVQA
jgi:hypothetical protein